MQYDVLVPGSEVLAALSNGRFGHEGKFWWCISLTFDLGFYGQLQVTSASRSGAIQHDLRNFQARVVFKFRDGFLQLLFQGTFLTL
jgi:hypothetical protein